MQRRKASAPSLKKFPLSYRPPPPLSTAAGAAHKLGGTAPPFRQRGAAPVSYTHLDDRRIRRLLPKGPKGPTGLWVRSPFCEMCIRDRVDTVANIFDYLEWRGDLRFDQAPFTCVDDLILCRLSYVPFDGVVPPLGEGGVISLRRAAERLLSPAFARQTEAMWARDRDLLRALAASARFGEMPILGYVNDCLLYTSRCV